VGGRRWRQGRWHRCAARRGPAVAAAARALGAGCCCHSGEAHRRATQLQEGLRRWPRPGLGEPEAEGCEPAGEEGGPPAAGEEGPSAHARALAGRGLRTAAGALRGLQGRELPGRAQGPEGKAPRRRSAIYHGAFQALQLRAACRDSQVWLRGQCQGRLLDGPDADQMEQRGSGNRPARFQDQPAFGSTSGPKATGRRGRLPPARGL